MFTKYPDDSVSCSACIRAIDLIRIADQMLKDDMKYAKVTVKFDYNEDYDGIVKLSAISAPDADDVKTYPLIKGLLLIDIDDEVY